MSELLRVIFLVGDSLGRPYYSLTVLSPRYSASPAERKAASAVKRPYPFRAVVVVTESFTTRVSVGMLVRLVRLIAKETIPFPVEFVATEQEGRARIAAMRKASL